MAGFTDRPPTFLSARSADVILSEIRPTKLNPEAWRSINVLLDELLWLILSTARSFSTESIKAGLLKVLPTPLGKEALLEAEVELRAYWDRTATAAPSRSYVDNVHEFPLQPAYELMRLKCETYSTLSDSDEDTDAEDRWQLKVTNASGFSPHNVPYISPAALYLTAIIEAVCEHILSNIGRVTARDSSRTTASLQDLYTALCEDETIYGLFKNMKVHEQIEAQSKAFGRPRRSKSINRPDHGRTSSHALSASFSTITGSDGLPAPLSKTRASSESAASGTPNASGVSLGQSASRGSLEKTRAKKLFGRGSAEKDGSQNSHGNNDNAGFHKRTESILSNGKRSTTPFDEGQHSPSATEVEFDELMRSGTTMKVSLTPDRLKSFEVYNKERGQRGTTKPAPRSTPPPNNSSNSNGNGEMKTTNGGVPSEPPITSDAPPSLPPINGQTTTHSARPSVQHESIMEDEEGGGSSSSSQRQRKKSRGPPPVAYDQGSLNSQTNRNRSMSAASVSLSHSHSQSQSQSQGASQGRHNVGRKSSLGAIGYIAPPPGSAGTGVGVGHHRGIGSRSGMSSKSGILDHDSLLDSDDDLPLMKKRGIGFQPKEARGGSGGTRDLISFLNEGPPEPPVPLPAESGRKQGRFKSMVSRLKRGGSTEKLTHSEQSSRNSSGVPPSFVPPPLSAKKSLHSISTYAQSQDGSSVMQKTPVSPPSPPSSPSHEEKEVKKGGMTPSSGRPPVPSAANRKAVPSLNGNAIPQQYQYQQQQQQQQTSVPPPPPPSQQQHQQVEALIAHKEVKKDAKPIEADMMTASSTTTLTASPRQDSLPRTNQSQTHSKHTARHALTPPASPASHVFANHVKDLRRLLANASNADECRLLVDMFLAQSGFPLSAAEYVQQQQPSLDEGLDKQQNEVVEALLSNGDALSTTTSTASADSTNPPTPKSNTHSPTITNFRKQPHATDTLAMAHVVSAEA